MFDEIAELRARHALATERINQLDGNCLEFHEFRGRPDNGESPTSPVATVRELWEAKLVHVHLAALHAVESSCTRSTTTGNAAAASSTSAPSNRCGRTSHARRPTLLLRHRPHHPKRRFPPASPEPAGLRQRRSPRPASLGVRRRTDPVVLTCGSAAAPSQNGASRTAARVIVHLACGRHQPACRGTVSGACVPTPMREGVARETRANNR